MPVTSRGSSAALAALLACACADPAPPPLGTLTELPTPAPPASAEPNLAAGPFGRVYLTWLERLPDSTHALRFATLDDSAWSAPRTVASGAGWVANWADFPALAALSDSELVAHWLVSRGPQWEAYDIRLARSLDGGASWSAPLSPHTDGTASEHGFVSLLPGVEGGGVVHAVWLDGRKYAWADSARRAGDSSRIREMTLRYAAIARDGRLVDEAELDPRTCDCCQTAATLTDDGPVVVYRDRTDREIRDIYLVRRGPDGWTAPIRVAADDWEINGCPVNGPAVAASGRHVVVAWFTAAGGTKRVYAAFSDDAGATFGARIVVDDGRPVGRVAVAYGDVGTAIVSWLEEVGEEAVVRVRRVAPDSTVGTATTVARTRAGRASGFPRMVRSGARLVFAWTEVTDSLPPRVRTATLPLAAAR